MTLCRRPEKRVVVPGLKTETGTALGSPVYKVQTRLWLVIDSMDEKPVTCNGYKRKAESHLYVGDYCRDQGEAIRLALRLHDESCPLDGCEWDEAERPKEKAEGPAAIFKRYYSGMFPTP
jgi:hypothetical protein